MIRHVHLSLIRSNFTDSKFLGWGITLSALSGMRELRTLVLWVHVRGWVDEVMATAVREMVRRTEAWVRVFLGEGGVKVNEWICGVWGEGEKEVFAEVVWGKIRRCGRGRGVDRGGQVGDSGDGRNESCRKYVLWAPVEPEGRARRVWVPRKMVEYEESMCGVTEVTEGLV